MDACQHNLDATIDLIVPSAILAVGSGASRALSDMALTMRNYRDRSGTVRYLGIPVYFTYHPAYILRNRAAALLLEEDLKEIRRILYGSARSEEAKEDKGTATPAEGGS
jgi:DNA polymerase